VCDHRSGNFTGADVSRKVLAEQLDCANRPVAGELINKRGRLPVHPH